MIECQRSDGQNTDPIRTDEKGKLVGTVLRTAIFHHPQMPRGNLVVDLVVEQYDAVGDVFLQPVAGELLAPALRRDHGGHAFVLEPAEEPAQFGAQDRLVGQARKQGFQRI